MTKIISPGVIFNRLTFIKYTEERNSDGRILGEFKCLCGNRKMLPVARIANGDVKSCGCLRLVSPSIFNKKHGLRSSPLYRVHNCMIRRCYNKNDKEYHNYGGRGILVDERWKDVTAFVYDMYPSYKKGLSLDRIDNNGWYSKENCRWATSDQQSRNKRNNVVYNGEFAKDAAIRLGGCKSLISTRLKRGWSKEKAFNTFITKRK